MSGREMRLASDYLPVPATFTRADGTTVSPSFMNQTGNIQYVDDGQAQIVGLPLFGGQLAVVVALPHADVTLTSYEAGLKVGGAALALPNASATVALALPRVTFTSPSFSLVEALKQMGMVKAFDSSADFSGLSAAASLYISDVRQKATISMQETGVEAAAATAVIFALTSAEILNPDPIVMNVDRPYLISVVDVPTGAVLFLGHIVDPTATGSM